MTTLLIKLLKWIKGLFVPVANVPMRREVPSTFSQVPWMKLFEADLKLDWKEKEPGDNPRIVKCFEDCGYGTRKDETAWCGVYVGATLLKAGFKPPEKCAWARNYSGKDWGIPLADPMYGCVVNIERNGTGGDSHVGFCVSWDANYVRIGGGNQNNSVTDTYLARRSKVISYKLPTR